MLLRRPSTSLLLSLLDVACDSCFVVADDLGLGKMCDLGIVVVDETDAVAAVVEFVDERIVGACFC